MSNVLLIEPNVVLAGTYMQALQHAGYTAVHARGAQEAVDAADATRPDVVVLELQLSGHSGVEFLHEFRSYGEWQTVPVIVNTHLSAQAIAAVQPALNSELGVHMCLYKPRTSLQQLLGAINQTLAAV